MNNSSDEDFNSDYEEIDLSPLWCSHPFLSESSNDADEEEYSSEEDAENFVSPVLLLTPIASSSSESRNESLMIELSDMNSRATTGRRQNYSSTTIGSQEQPDSTSTYPSRTWTRYRLHYADGQPSAPIMPFDDEEEIPRRTVSPFFDEESQVSYFNSEANDSARNSLQ